MAESEGGLLCAPPTDFKRMLSWKLSGPPVSSSKKKTKRGKKQLLRDEKALSNQQTLLDDDFDSFDDDFSDLDSYEYVVVNSEGEEEVYFSAPESPMSSDNDFDDVTTTSSDWLAANVRADLPPQERKPGGRSKKNKKKSRYLAKLAEVEFFQPLCDRFEENASLDVGKLDVSSQAAVPTLAELSIRKIHSEELVHSSNDLPFLVHCLLGHDRQLRFVVSTHVRWLERLLAAFEVAAKQKREDRQQNAEKDPEEGQAYCQQASWDSLTQLNEIPPCGSGLHCPLPNTFSRRCLRPYESVSKVYLMKPLFHFANYFFPLSTAKGKDAVRQQDGASLVSPSQRAAISYVNKFLKSRYKSLTSELSETLKLWPGYVYWARGQLKLAADTFAATIDALKHSYDQAVALNEVGRMFLHFGDRTSACRFFRKSAVVVTKVQGVYKPTSDLVSPCAFALEASAWDCGWLDEGVAREAARGWRMVVKEAANLPIVFWFLHMAACESRLFVHAGRPVGFDPSSPLESASAQTGVSPTQQWLSECENQLLKFSETFQILHYHLSLVYAMQKMSYLSHKAFRTFHDEYVGFREWPGGILPGDLFPTLLPVRQRNPWTPLIELLTNQKLSHAPVLQLQWRVRLLHPVYPYAKPEGVCYLAEHGSPDIGLRFTRDGYLTADLHMDLPPMRCVLIDPYTGSLCFSRSASLEHYFQNPSGEPLRRELCLLPWPLRLFESEQCVVELIEGLTLDVELSEKVESNYMAVLHWYGNDGAHRKLDIRRAIRKSLRKAILGLAQRKGLEGKEALLTKMMERGYHVEIQDLRRDNVPSKYRKQIGSGKETTKPRKVRNQEVSDFVLHLTSHVVYGEGTLMLCFLLNPWMEDDSAFQGQALMFVDCTDCDSFLNPRVYCVPDHRGFQCLYPSTEMASAYTNRHLRHIRYAMAVCTEQVPDSENDHKQLVFDQKGDIVHEKCLKIAGRRNTRRWVYIAKEDLHASFSLGDHLFHQKNGEESKVLRYDTRLRRKSTLSSVPFQSTTILDIIPVPGLLLVHTPQGLCLLHPGNLQPVTIEGLKEAAPDPADLNPHIQFKGDDMIFQVMKVYNVERQCTVEVVAKHMSECSEGQEVESVSPAGDTLEEEEVETEPGQCGTLREGEGTDSDSGEEFTTEAEKMEGETSCKERRDPTDFGSCYVAFTINNRLLVLSVSHRTETVSIILDVSLPGKMTEFHQMGKLGYMLSVTQFPDQFREEVYWVSESGELLGMLPCLGAGPRSFLSATLNPRPSSGSMAATSQYQAMEEKDLEEEEEDSGGHYVFFNDGQGGICCIRN